MKTHETFSSFSVDDVGKAKAFYRDTLGLDVSDEKGMGSSCGCLEGPVRSSTPRKTIGLRPSPS